MSNRVELQGLLASVDGDVARRRALFAWLNMGLIESLANGLLSGDDAIRLFCHADNCLFVRKRLRGRLANEVMSRGAQLPDLHEALPPDEARREFLHELGEMRRLCLKLLETEPLVV